MIQQSQPTVQPVSRPRPVSAGRIAWWLLVIVSMGLLIFLLTSEVLRFSTPIPLQKLKLVQDIPLPDALPDPNRTSSNPFAAGQAQRFDHFDFQSYDANKHLLFIVHTGPNPDKEAAILHNPNFDAKTDGNVVVFDTQQNKVVGLVPVPLAAGIMVAPDVGKVFAGDANDGIVYIFNEQSPFQIIAKVQLDPLDGPDAIEYDSVDHLVFVSDPGAPGNPDNANVDRKNQNVAVIDANTDKLLTKIPLGLDPRFSSDSRFGKEVVGADVGHIQFDPVTHRVYVVTLPLADQNLDPDQLLAIQKQLPSYLAVIDPITKKIVSSIRLPGACTSPHGLVIDVQQREAFVACVDSQNTVRVDLQTMQPFAESPLPVAFNPDIVRLDHTAHLLVIGCAGGISLFDISNRQLKKLGNYFLGGGSHHTIAIDESKQVLYLPQPSVGERPVLRIIKYVPDGI